MDRAYKIDVEKLTHSDLEELERILIHRWKQLYPDWEMVIISLPQDDADMRRKIIVYLITCSPSGGAGTA